MRQFLRVLAVQARRDRWVLAVWIIGIGLLGLAVGSAIGTEFGEESERASIMAVAATNPAFLFLRGLPDGLSIGAVAFFQAYSFTAVLAGLMSTFLVVRHTRADEELGRAELIGSTPIARSHPLGATLTLGVLANVTLAIVVALGYIAGGLPVEGSVVAALAVAAVGLVFVGVAAVIAQVMPTGRGANGLAASLVGAAYLVRGIGDARGEPDATLTTVEPLWVSWLSPIGWGQATRPYSEADVTPLLLALGAFLALAVGALALRRGRDLGSSLIADRDGRDRAGVGGRSILGLAWRLQRPVLIGWCVGGATLGLVAGGLAPTVADVAEGNDSLGELIARLVPGSRADIVDIFTVGLLGIAGVLAAAAGVHAIIRQRSEEAEGRAELLLATPVSRVQWIGGTLIVSAVSVLAVCAVAGTAAGATIAIADADGAAVPRFLGAAIAHVPAALVLVGVAALVFAVVPRLTNALGWGLLILALVIGQFGELLSLPEWLQDASPFHHTSAVPIEVFDVASALIVIAVAAAATGAAIVLVRRRDVSV